MGATRSATSTSTSGSVSYTNGTGTGNVFVADANIQIKEGTGKDYPFNTSYNPRVPNITCYYDCSVSCCTAPTMSMTQTSCAGACDGTATATVGAGGVAPYTYQWEDDLGNIAASTASTGTGLNAAVWTCTVTDANGCTQESGIFTIYCLIKRQK